MASVEASAFLSAVKDVSIVKMETARSAVQITFWLKKKAKVFVKNVILCFSTARFALTLKLVKNVNLVTLRAMFSLGSAPSELELTTREWTFCERIFFKITFSKF